MGISLAKVSHDSGADQWTATLREVGVNYAKAQRLAYKLIDPVPAEGLIVSGASSIARLLPQARGRTTRWVRAQPKAPHATGPRDCRRHIRQCSHWRQSHQ